MHDEWFASAWRKVTKDSSTGSGGLSGLGCQRSTWGVHGLRSVVFLLHQLQKSVNMKATNLILTTALSLQMGVLMIGHDVINSSNETNVPVITESVAPVTPVEATFEEVNTMDLNAGLAPTVPFEATFEEMGTVDAVLELAPVVPAEASFEDAPVELTFELLAPVTPAEADFEDAANEQMVTGLAPVTPEEATFEDASTEMVSIRDLAPVTPKEADFE